jgi:predicted PurR-regulated permease PerM
MAAAERTASDDLVLPRPRPSTMSRFGIIVAAATVLYVAQAIFLPLAIAMLVAFALSPLVTRLRRTGLGTLWTVLIVVTASFLVVALFAFVVSGQLAQLAQNLPTFRGNIIQKVEGLRQASGDNGLVSRLTEMVNAISATVEQSMPGDAADSKVTPVRVVERTSIYDLLTSFLLPLLGPLTTAGLVVILVVFMLLERDQLRERFIRLVGASDLYRTTRVLDEAGSRVGTYLLTQILVNIIYAVPIMLGLWLIGVPNALLWGLLTLVLRFVPYIGSAISAAFPMALAFAVSPGWGMVLWTGALFLGVEFVTSNVVEPWLYGSRTGVSPLAIIISAIFWAFLWGPLGLVLSTPLTVCLVVLGRHIPQFDLFDIMFGDAPVLMPHASLYQRLLSGDRMEVGFRAEEALEEEGLDEFYQTTALPALIVASDDRSRGVLSPDGEVRLAAAVMAMVEDLKAMAPEPEDEGDEAGAAPQELRVTVVGGRWEIDDSSAEILAHVLITRGVEAKARSFADLAPTRIKAAVVKETDCVILCFLDQYPSRASLLHIRRIKRLNARLRVGVVLWELPSDLRVKEQGLRVISGVSPEKLAEAVEIGASFAVTTLKDACTALFTPTEAVTRAEPEKKPLKHSA